MLHTLVAWGLTTYGMLAGAKLPYDKYRIVSTSFPAGKVAKVDTTGSDDKPFKVSSSTAASQLCTDRPAQLLLQAAQHCCAHHQHLPVACACGPNPVDAADVTHMLWGSAAPCLLSVQIHYDDGDKEWVTLNE
jgi:hypothetical protein